MWKANTAAVVLWLHFSPPTLYGYTLGPHKYNQYQFPVKSVHSSQAQQVDLQNNKKPMGHIAYLTNTSLFPAEDESVLMNSQCLFKSIIYTKCFCTYNILRSTILYNSRSFFPLKSGFCECFIQIIPPCDIRTFRDMGVFGGKQK